MTERTVLFVCQRGGAKTAGANRPGSNGIDWQYIYTADDERIALYTGQGQWRFTVRDLDARRAGQPRLRLHSLPIVIAARNASRRAADLTAHPPTP